MKWIIFLSSFLFTCRVDAEFNLTDALFRSYYGLKQRNIYDYDLHLVHRPFSEFPDDIVSEGVGYGLLTSLYMDDHETFDALFSNAEYHMWNGQYYDWHIDREGNLLDRGGALDAEEDIALSLIFAVRKMQKKEWPDDRLIPYQTRAQQILDHLWTVRMITQDGNLCPGNNWGCDQFVNPSYFAPAWYKIYARFDTSGHDWVRVIDKNYQLLEGSPGYENGLVPDWVSVNGGFMDNTALGYNAYGGGRYFYKDAIRTLLRIGLDYLWFGDERAKKYLVNAKDFIMRKGGAPMANFFTIAPDASLLPEDDVWIFDNGQRLRTRREHSHMTIAMWAVPIYLVGSESEKLSFKDELSTFYEIGASYWGKTLDPIHQEDIQHNEMYFDQFLTIFGALIMDDRFINLE